MFLDSILFLLGFVLLIKGADWLVDGASSLAHKMGVSTLVIGLTVVSFGTSAPELLVNLIASFQDANDLAIGNILGSNISNILLILGISAMIRPLTIGRGTVYREIPFSFFAVLLLGVLVNDIFFQAERNLILSRLDGVILLAFFGLFLYYAFVISKVKGHDGDVDERSKFTSIMLVLGGMISLALGGKWIVDGAITLAQSIGVSQAFIGLSVVAIGTSLPELAATAVAAYRKQSDIAIGNIIGSNVFNLLWILGISTLIKPLQFSAQLNLDLLVVMLATLVLFFYMFHGKKNVLVRREGMVLLGLYIIYLFYITLRG